MTGLGVGHKGPRQVSTMVSAFVVEASTHVLAGPFFEKREKGPPVPGVQHLPSGITNKDAAVGGWGGHVT